MCFLQVLKKMHDVMHRYESVGLAAPQIGVPLRIFMIEFSEKMNEKFSPDIQKSREMAIIPLKVSWYGDSMSSLYHSNIYSILLCLYEGQFYLLPQG
jgi:peptide deformylase